MWRNAYPKAVVKELREKPLSSEIIEKIDLLASIIPNETNWLVIKKLLKNQLCSADRSLLSRRDDTTRRHFVYNTFEENIRVRWYEMTGKILVMPPEKMMRGVPKEAYESMPKVHYLSEDEDE
jgi:uncharacterized FlgJ-related protein